MKRFHIFVMKFHFKKGQKVVAPLRLRDGLRREEKLFCALFLHDYAALCFLRSHRAKRYVMPDAFLVG